MRNYHPQFLLVETEFGGELLLNYNDINTIEPCDIYPSTRTIITFTDASLHETRTKVKIAFAELVEQMGEDVRAVRRRQ